jgi:hypothetical protein
MPQTYKFNVTNSTSSKQNYFVSSINSTLTVDFSYDPVCTYNSGLAYCCLVNTTLSAADLARISAVNFTQAQLNALTRPPGSSAGNVSLCPSSLYVQCPCVNGTINLPVPIYTLLVPSTTFGAVQCTAGNQVTCGCNSTYFTTAFPPVNGSVIYDFYRFSNFTPLFIFRNNSACDASYGVGLIEQSNNLAFPTTYWAVLTGTTTLPLPYHIRAPMSEMFNQLNEFVTGTVADMILNPPWSPYSYNCTQGCLQYIPYPPTPGNYSCVIDATVSPGTPEYGTRVFASWYDAVEAIQNDLANCSNGRILVNNAGQPYTEPNPNLSATSGSTSTTTNPTVLFTDKHAGYIWISLSNAVTITDAFVFDASISRDGSSDNLPTWTTHPLDLFYDTPSPYGQTGHCAFSRDNLNDGSCPVIFGGHTFIHPGTGSGAIFSVTGEGKLSTLVFYNMQFNGGGAGKAGVINTGKIQNLVTRYSTFSNWNSVGLKASSSGSVTMEFCFWNTSMGKIADFRIQSIVSVQHNLFFNVRGQASGHGGPMLSIVGRLENLLAAFSGQMIQGEFESTCLEEPLNDSLPINYYLPGATCFVRDNLQTVDADTLVAADQTDTFLYLNNLNIPPERVTDNGADKAQFGAAFIDCSLINEGNIDQLFRLNPRFRTETYRSTDPGVPPGSDMTGRSVSISISFNLASIGLIGIWTAQFPGSKYAIQAWRNGTYDCQVNGQWALGRLPHYDMEGNIPRYAYDMYETVSDGALYCNNTRMVVGYNGADKVSLSTLFVTIANGSRYVNRLVVAK